MSKCKIQYKYKIKRRSKEDIEFEDLVNFANQYGDKIADEINEITAEDRYKNAMKITKFAIDLFYNSYDPHMYHRTYSLYDLFDIGITGNNEFYFNITDDLLGWHRDTEAMLEYDFIRGYHGGMLWRTPTPKYIEEHGPGMVNTLGGVKFATRPWQYYHPIATKKMNESPYDYIQRVWIEYIEKYYPKIQQSALKKVMGKYVDMFNWRT